MKNELFSQLGYAIGVCCDWLLGGGFANSLVT